ncbi:hypothetical protein ALNOE001_08920 [Candidatus Methanobinarius endosymbioticus]|uniref:Uncharacterized protein n=1 Tax=Candidatus Methanobinarius endosymbioticus TaxID=2006182 RepID=A0A366MBY7_9EURY|nr:hypothetical protein ALNOE001_08920 [Candidatus Methanobinarius endosymbioticus]
MVLDLYFNALNGISGVYDEGNIYDVDKEELNKFEKGFIEKEKKLTKTQERFLELSINSYNQLININIK